MPPDYRRGAEASRCATAPRSREAIIDRKPSPPTIARRGAARRSTATQAVHAAFVIAAFSWIVGSAAVRSSWVLPRLSRRTTAPPGQDFVLRSLDGVALAASYWPGARENAPGLLIVHGLSATRRVIECNAEWFAAQGYAVLTIDLRGHGESGRAHHTFGWTESYDAHAAFAWLKHRQGGAAVAAVGISMGGAALLLGPLGPVPAQALVLQGVFSTFRRTVRQRLAFAAGLGVGWLLEPLLSLQTRPRLGVWPSRMAPKTILSTIGCPVFVMGGEKDRFTPVDETRELFDAVAGAKRLWVVPHLGHGGISDIASTEYRERVLDYLRASFGEA